MWAYYRSLRQGRDLDAAAVTVVGPLHIESGLNDDSCSFLARAWSVALIALPAVVMLVLGYMRRHVSDDALIYSRVVRQILAGNGPVFNLGERAEASTSTLWQWLLVFAGWATRIDVVQLAVFGSLLLTAAAFVVALDGTRRFQQGPERSRTLIPAGVLLLLAVPPIWDYSTTGLESGLQSLWLATCWWLLVRTRSVLRLPSLVLMFVVIGLGPLVRPELGLVSIIFLVSALMCIRPTSGTAIALLSSAGLLPAAYEVFRAGYFGLLVPLPALAKEAATTDLPRGAAYVWDFVGPYWLAWPLVAVGALVAAGLFRRSSGAERQFAHRDATILFAPLLASVALTTYVTVIGGDYMHARMLLAPLFLLVLPVLLVPITLFNVALVSMIALWAVLALSPLRAPFDGGGTTGGIDTRNIRLEDEERTKRANPTTVADWLNGFAWLPSVVDRAALTPGPVLMYGPEDSVAAPARADLGVDVAMTGGFLGITGSVAPLDYRVVDMFGLTYPIGGHFELADRGDLPGHEKLLSVIWLFADYADPGAQAQGRLPAVTLQVSIAAARRALNCGELQELQESVREPMSWHRFQKNLVGSLRRTQLRIPLDPFTAEARFCRDPH